MPRFGCKPQCDCKDEAERAELRQARDAEGPGRERDVLLLSTGRTLEVWRDALREGPVRSVDAREWRPGRTPAPDRPAEGLRLFVFGVPAVRTRIRSDLGREHRDDWFGA